VFVQHKTTKAVLNAIYLTENNTKPLPPTNVTASQAGTTLHINLSWTPPAGTISGYNVYRNGVKINTTPVTGTTYKDEVSKYGITYRYGVAAINSGVESFWGIATAFTDITVPAPINLTVKQIRGYNMSVSWKKPAEFDQPLKYKVYRNNILQNPEAPLFTETTINNKGISYREYCFEIEPILNEITGPRSANVCITLINVPAPTNLKAEQVFYNSKEVRLTWTASDAAGYNVYRDDVKINTELVTSPKYTDIAPAYDVNYTYLVYGVAETGAESDKSATASITLLGEVSIPQIDEDALFTIYPNPTTGQLRITNRSPVRGELSEANYELRIESVEIFDVYGRKVFEQKENLTVLLSYDLTFLSSGIYIIRISTEKGFAEKRFIRN
jgi:hypothetical protein